MHLHYRRIWALLLKLLFSLFALSILPAVADQTITLDGHAGGKRFDGIGAVSGGGATSVLLKDYPEPQRGQVLDLLFKPKFGASMSALLVEVPGDGNSTQGSEPSHMHSRDDLNFRRGYEWWLMSEAKKRNPALTLDACAWSCPGWVGNGDFWSQDMCDFYVKWIQGLKRCYGLNLDAIGCRNEKGVNEKFVKMFRASLNSHGLNAVKIHGFDNWGKNKFDWTKDLNTDPELRAAVDILSNHTMAETATPANVQKLAESLGKPIWNSEEHVYKKGFDCEISLVQAFNENFIRSGVTKIVAWYLVGSVYPLEPYSEDPAALIANSPWSGHYRTREVLWGYAHYGQFSQVGWQYLTGACGNLTGGGTFVTLKSPGDDYSIIIETKGADAPRNVNFRIGGGLSARRLCVWRSDATAQFVQQAPIEPVHGSFSITLEPDAVYSISTTRGQRKGSFDSIPPDKDFPFPYSENFDEYHDPAQWGYLPHYTADIAGIFEIADRPDRSGECLSQVLDQRPQSWAPEWMPYTIIGDDKWSDYEVSADVYLPKQGAAGVMGRVSSVGYGYGSVPQGYYMEVAAEGHCFLFAATPSTNHINSIQLATGTTTQVAARQWHNVKLRFSGDILAGFVDGSLVLSATNSLYSHGMAGLITGHDTSHRDVAYFDHFLINPVDAPPGRPTRFKRNQSPIYSRAAGF